MMSRCWPRKKMNHCQLYSVRVLIIEYVTIDWSFFYWVITIWQIQNMLHIFAIWSIIFSITAGRIYEGICGLPMNTNPRLKWRTAFRRHLLVVSLQQVQLLGRNTRPFIRFGQVYAWHWVHNKKKAAEPYIDRTNMDIKTSKSLAVRVTMKTTCDCQPPWQLSCSRILTMDFRTPIFSCPFLAWAERDDRNDYTDWCWLMNNKSNAFHFGWWFLDTLWMLDWNSPWVGACVWCSFGEGCKRTLPTLESGRPPSLPTPGGKLDGHKAGWDVGDLHGISGI